MCPLICIPWAMALRGTHKTGSRIAAARQAWEQAVTLLQDPAYDMIILDELNIVLRYGYLPLESVLETLQQKREMLHVVITGRHANKGWLRWRIWSRR